MIKARSFSHTAIKISDLEPAKEFYEKVLGLKPLPRPDFGFPGAWYGVGNNQIHLISSAGSSRKINPLGAHFAIEVEDFEETRRTLKELGIEFLEAPGTIAGHQLWVLDPDGNTVELRTDK